MKTREQKIVALKAIASGTPLKFALSPNDYRILQKNQGDALWQTSTGQIITELERELYLPDSVCIENVSRHFKIIDGLIVAMEW